jgi:hypothetical protein
MRRLSSGLPGTIAGPDFPPFSTSSRESSSRPPIFADLWQPKQFFDRTGKTFVRKNSAGSAVAGRAGIARNVNEIRPGRNGTFTT